MSLVCVRATFECDGCGCQFRVEMDPATMRPKGWSLMEEAEDYLRGMCSADGGLPAMVHDLHLCDDCHAVAAEVRPEEDQYAPREEIVAALASSNDAMKRTKRSGLGKTAEVPK